MKTEKRIALRTCVGQSSEEDCEKPEHEEHYHHHFPTLTRHPGSVSAFSRSFPSQFEKRQSSAEMISE